VLFLLGGFVDDAAGISDWVMKRALDHERDGEGGKFIHGGIASAQRRATRWEWVSAWLANYVKKNGDEQATGTIHLPQVSLLHRAALWASLLFCGELSR
jgi:hypothetical protein